MNFLLVLQPTRRHRRGSVLIESLVASCIVAMSLAALVSLWRFSYRMTTRTDDKGVACNLARQTMEAVKQSGFNNMSEITVAAPTIHYFDAHEQNQDASPSAARYKVTLSVVSDSLIAASSPATPTPDALRTVTITVIEVDNGETLYQTSTYLARSGI